MPVILKRLHARLAIDLISARVFLFLMVIVGVLPMSLHGAWQTPGAATSAPTSDVSAAAPPAPPAETGWSDLPIWPELNPVQLSWFALVTCLALTLRARPFWTLQNLDGLTLGFACLLFVLRDSTATAAHGHPWHWWGVTLLAAVVGYWILRGAALFADVRPPRSDRTGVGSVVLVFAITTALLAAQTLRSGLHSAATYDGVCGALAFDENGALPYGDLPGHDGRSPLLYLWHAGLIQAMPLQWLSDDPASFQEQYRPEQILALDLAKPVRCIAAPFRVGNAILAVLTCIGLFLVGSRCASPTTGLGMATIFLIFPGVREGLNDPELMLAAGLVTWSLAFSLVPVVGAFLSMICAVAGGVVIPWIWLGAPVLFAYHARGGWRLLGAFIGLTLGLAAIGAGLTRWVSPTLPRADGILEVADLPPKYRAELSADETALSILFDAQKSRRSGHMLETAARRLLDQEALTVVQAVGRAESPRIVLPEGVAPESVQYRDIAATGEAERILQGHYRYDMHFFSERARFFAALRTVLESTWLPRKDAVEYERSAWRAWGAFETERAAKFESVRRSVKIAAAAIAIVLALAMLVRGDVTFGGLAGGFVVILAVAFVAGIYGPGARWAWILPAILIAHAVQRREEAVVERLPEGMYTPELIAPDQYFAAPTPPERAPAPLPRLGPPPYRGA